MDGDLAQTSHHQDLLQVKVKVSSYHFDTKITKVLASGHVRSLPLRDLLGTFWSVYRTLHHLA